MDADDLTPEEIDALDAKKKLAAENASRRRKLREAEAKIAKLTALVRDLSAFINAFSSAQEETE